MLKSKSYIKKTRRGGVVTVINEHYLRDDIYCGSKLCTKCAHIDRILSNSPNTLDPIGPHYLVPDTNVFLQHMDFIEHPATKDIIILQTVLNEVRHRNTTTYNRLRTVIGNPDRRCFVFSNEHHRSTFIEKNENESPNDRNDRAIRVTVQWYQHHLSHAKMNVVLLTEDKANREKAHQEQLLAFSVTDYADLFINVVPELLDLIASTSDASLTLDSKDQQTSTTSILYEEYKSSALLNDGLAHQKYHLGAFSVSPYNRLEGWIQSSTFQDGAKIFIQGKQNINRAIHGDQVVVEILPESFWKKEEKLLLDSDHEEGEDNEDKLMTNSMSGEIDINNNDLKIEIHSSFTTSSANATSSEISKDSNLFRNCIFYPSGRVVGVMKRHWRPYCGILDPKTVRTSVGSSVQWVLFQPTDKKIPKIRLRTRQGPQLLHQKIVVTIDAWERNSMYPLGHFVRALGPSRDKSIETEVILLEHGVPYSAFSNQIMKELPVEGEAWKISPDEIQRRTDLRHLPICSIDPPGCTDIDDALHAIRLPNGHFQVGVHIADVGYFVKPGMAMDLEASTRCTTVYLVDKRIDMLPALLGSHLCSLKCNVDRLTFSCIWELTPDAEIVQVHFTKSVIHSKASFTYAEAQQRIDQSSVNKEDEDDPLTLGLRDLNQLSKLLRAKRMAQGALTLASPEVRFRLEGDAQDPIDIELKELQETNALVEEFMLLANIAVAKHLFTVFPETALLRNHPAPAAHQFSPLLQALERFSFDIDVTSSKTLATSLDQAKIPSDPFFNTLVRILTTRCMMQACYISSGMVPEQDFWHYGLATPIYTHFTSPIRRYSDIVVHRLLASSLMSTSILSSNTPQSTFASVSSSSFSYHDASIMVPMSLDKHQLHTLCQTLNERHRLAQLASRGSVELYTRVFLHAKHVQTSGYVCKVMRNGVSVLIPEWGLECPLVLSTTTWQYQSKAGYLQHHTLTSIQLHVFTKVELNVCVSDEGDEASEASWQGVQITLGSMISDPLLGVQHILLSSNETTESCVPQKRKQ